MGVQLLLILLKFLPVIVSIAPISALALDFLVIRSMDKNEHGYAENEKVASQYIEDRKEQYADLTVIKISGPSSQSVIFRTPNATGTNRIIYVDRGQIDSWEFLKTR